MIQTTEIITSGEQNGTVFTKIRRPEHFDIYKIFDCGQCFRFDPSSLGGIEGVAFGRYLRAEQTDTEIILHGCGEDDYRNIWHRYLGLDRDYGQVNREILAELDGDAVMARAMDVGDGIRILRQDMWETLCSFIISQNNNIPRIKKIIDSLCRTLGEPINSPDGRVFYTFPSAETVLDAGQDLIFSLRTGFRAKYIIDAARAFPTLPTRQMCGDMTYGEAQSYLTDIKGVGPKVSSCVLLFGFGRHEAFPIDVWIKKVLDKYYGGNFDPSRIGRYAGVAQQYLFYYERYDENK